MPLYVGTHATEPENLESIMAQGLEPRLPSENHWSFLDKQPRGVYTLPIDEDPWARYGTEYSLRVAYFGPMIPDPLVEEAIVLEDRVDPQWISPDDE